MTARNLTLKIAGCLATVALAALCYAQVRNNQMKIDIEKESGLSAVLGLADEFRRTSDTNTLIQLAGLVEDKKHGANATASMAGLRTNLTAEQITSIVVPALIKGLQSSDAAVRRATSISILHKFVEFAQPAVPALIQVLEDPSEVVNAAPIAAEVLGKIGTRSAGAIPNLLRVLECSDLESDGLEEGCVRACAATAIGQIGIKSEELCKRVEKILGDSNPYIRATSARALLRNACSSNAAVTTLAELMKAEDVGVRRFAFQVVKDLQSTPESLRELLKNALNDPDPEVASAARAILNGRSH